MNDSIQIEEASWRDFNELRQLENECFPVDAWPVWDVLGILSLPSVIRLKATQSGKMIGFIACDIRRHEAIAWIATLAVKAGHRRLGIASALIGACEVQLAVKRVKLCVRRSNAPAIALYRKLGYHESGIWENYYIGGEDALILEKILDGI